MWVEGNADYRDNPLTRERVHMVSFGKKAYSFKKKDIPKFTTSYFWEWAKLWKWWRKDRLPYNKGWMEHPWKVIRVIELFDALYEDNERKRQKQRADEHRR